jgi:hypothetical protein
MNNHRATVNQPTTITFQVPTRDQLAGQRTLIPVAFSLVILLFFFSFCNFKLVGAMAESEYQASEKSVSGFDFITGTTLPTAGISNDLTSGLLGIKTDHAENLGKISFSIWPLITLASCIGGIFVFWKREKKEALLGMLLASAGILAQLMLMSAVKKYEGRIDAGFVTLQTKMIFQFSYWLSLVSLLIAGGISFLRLKIEPKMTSEPIANTPAAVHVNIITTQPDAAEPI